MKSKVFFGRVCHHRTAPIQHEFAYRVAQLYLDLDELDTVFRGKWLWSTRSPNLARFARQDHLGDKSTPLSESVRILVENKTGVRPSGPIRLLTYPRFFGFVINPVSFYFCFDESDESLTHIVAEVNNTPWGEQHCYVLPCAETMDNQGWMQFTFDKAFHVSPFMPMNQSYEWSFRMTDGLQIQMKNIEDQKLQFEARMNLVSAPIHSRSLLRVLIFYPFMTGKVLVAIYWQALRLWLKKAPFHSHPNSLPLKESTGSNS